MAGMIWLAVAGAVLAAGVVGYLVAGRRTSQAESRAAAEQAAARELREQVGAAQRDFEGLRDKNSRLEAERADALARLEESHKNLLAQKELLETAKSQLTDVFRSLAGEALNTSTTSFLTLAKETLDKVLGDAKGDLGKRQEAIDGLVRPLSESLKQFQENLSKVEVQRKSAYQGLAEQVKSLATDQQQLQKETRNLVTALRTPKFVGAWGQVALERVVELSGMSEHCDFTKEVSVTTETGRLRPDMVVH